MKIRTNLYLITAILLTSNLLTLCKGVSDIHNEPFSDHLDHLDDLHDINNFDDHKVIHSVELVQHNGDSMSKYATTSHTNQETDDKLFSNTIPIIQQSKVPVPATFTKVVKQMVIKQSNNDGNNSPVTDLSMNDAYGNNKLINNGIGNSILKSQTLSQMDHVKNIGLAIQQVPDTQGNIKNIIHTTVTKTTTNRNPSNELNESFNKMHNLDTLPPLNHIMSTVSSTNTNYKDGITNSGSSQSNSMVGNSKIKTISMAEDTIDGNGFDNSKRIFHKPGGFRRMKTTIIKQHNIDDNNNHSDLDKSIIGFNTENTSSNNIESMTNPLEYNTVTTTTFDRDNSNDSVFNKGIPSRKQQNRFNKLNVFENSVSETGASQNPGSIVHTKTTIIKNGRAADEIKLDDLNNNKIDFNIDKGLATSNNKINSNYFISSNKNGNDNDNGYSYSYGYGKYNGNLNNMYNGNIVSSNDLMDGAGGYSSYMISNGYSNGNGKKKKRKKNGSVKKYKDNSSKNISYNEKSKGNGQIIVKKDRKNKNTRSSKKRSGGNSQYYYSSKQSKSFSSLDSASDESSMMKKKQCHCNEVRKLNKRDSNESNGSNRSNELRETGNSMDNQPMQNNGKFIIRFPPPIPPFIKHEPPLNLLFNMVQGQRPDQSLNYSQSDLSSALNRLEETRSQMINNYKLPNIDVSNQLTYQTPNTDSVYKPDFQQEQYFGPPVPHPGSGPDIIPYPFDSSSFAGGDYRKFHEQNLQLIPLSQFPYPYSFNQDYDTDLSKMGLTTPELTNIQSGQENQININTDLPQIQYTDNEGTGFNRMDAPNSGPMTTSSRSNIIKNTNDGPIIKYIKTFKTTENIDGNGTPDMQIVQTQSVPPKVNGYGNYIIKYLK